MPNATELCSLSDLKSYLLITTTSKDAILQPIKDSVEAFIKQYTGRDLLVPASPYIEYYDGDGSAKLILNQRPIISIASIYVDPARLFQGNTLIPSYDITTFSLQDGTPAVDQKAANAGVVELYYYRFLRGRKNVQVTYLAGYATVPADLAHAVKLIAAQEYKLQDKQMAGETMQRVGDKEISLSLDSVPKKAIEILDRYTRIVI